MQVVIEIPEEHFERCKKKFQMRIGIMGDAIANGTPLPENPTNGDMVQAVFDDRGYKAIKERMEHTMWWKAPYEKERKE